MGASRRRAVAAAVAALVGPLSVSGCTPTPEDPADDELSGVVVSRNDHPMLGGGGTVDAWSRVLVLTRDDLLAAYDAAWPGRDDPADHVIAGVVVDIDTADLPPEDVADIDEGRFRLAWPEAGRYVCLGNEHQGTVTTAGCVLVDGEAPVAVTIEVSIGGLSVAG